MNSETTITRSDVLPTRRSVILGTVFAAIIFIDLAEASYQLAFAYFSGQGLDLAASDFWLPASFFLLCTYAACFQLRKLARALGLRHGLKQHVVVAQYQPPCGPAVAGALMDDEFSLAEIKGMMIDLAYRAVLERSAADGGEVWTLSPADTSGLSASEQALIGSLFTDNATLQLPHMRAALTQAAPAIHDAILAEAAASGLIKLTDPSSLFAQIARIIAGIGYGAAALMFLVGVLDPKDVLTVHYPRYPVYLWQLLFLVFQIIIILLVVGTSYRRSFLTATGLDVTANIAGFYLYIKTVFQNPANFLAQSDLHTFYPYAVAFRLPTKLPPGDPDNWDVLLSL